MCVCVCVYVCVYSVYAHLGMYDVFSNGSTRFTIHYSFLWCDVISENLMPTNNFYVLTYVQCQSTMYTNAHLLPMYSAFPSSCNFRLQQRQPCEPIREQNLNPSAI